MKLRNKKTGEVMGLSMAGDIVWVGNYRYESLARLNKEWEDYEPKEPLIKDEKIRKGVRAWAEANRTKYVWVSTTLKGIDITQDFEHLQLTEFKQSITFECEADFESGYYTINELCGEEEE